MRRFLPVAGPALVLAVYLLTMAPALSWAHHGADGGDFVTAVARGSIPHPPGFPTYLLLGEPFLLLPLRNPAWRLNLLSAAAAAVTVGLTIWAVRHVGRETSWIVAVSAGLSLGLAPLFWSQALITEVYAPAAFFSALVILLVLRGDPAWAVGLALGLGMGAHPTVVFLAPVAIWGVGREKTPHLTSPQRGEGSRRVDGVDHRSISHSTPSQLGSSEEPEGSAREDGASGSSSSHSRDRAFGSREGGWEEKGGAGDFVCPEGGAPHLTSPQRGEGLGEKGGGPQLASAQGGGGWQWRVWRLAELGVAALAAWAVLYGPVLLARRGVPSPWADVSSLDGWWVLVSARLYRGYVFALPLTAWPRRLLAWMGLLARQFTPLGALLAGLGWSELHCERRGLAVSSLASLGLFSLFAMGYDTADSLVYLVPALPLAAIWLGVGLDRAEEWAGVRFQGLGRAVILILPIVQAVLFWRSVDVSGDLTAMAWMERVLEAAPTDALVITASDAHTFTLWYAQEVLDRRPDLVVVDQDLWHQEVYRQQLVAELDLSEVEPTLSVEQAARRSGRSIVEISADE